MRSSVTSMSTKPAFGEHRRGSRRAARPRTGRRRRRPPSRESRRGPRRAGRCRRPTAVPRASGPGRRPAKTCCLSGTRLITQLLMIASTVASATGRCSISPSRNSTLSNPRLRRVPACARDHLGSHVDADHSARGPTRLAARKQSIPPPLPRSSTVSPGCSSSSASGFPHPRPRFAPSGMPRSRPGRSRARRPDASRPACYRCRSRTDCAVDGPQHDDPLVACPA